MRFSIIAIAVCLILNLLVDWYIFRYLVSELRRRFWAHVQFWSAIIFALGLVALALVPLRSASNSVFLIAMWVVYIYISVYAAKYIFVLFDSLGRLPVLWHRKKLRYMPGIGLVLGIAAFMILWYGACIGRYQTSIKEVDVSFKDLPAGFDGYKIVQISDFHLGTYDTNTAFADKVVKKINDLHPDAVMFTGDIVNRQTSELKPFVSSLAAIKAPDGVFSILGNHDYGDYFEWPDSTDKMKNLNDMKLLQKQMGWNLLTNKSAYIAKGSDSIVIVGVENIGEPPFNIYGDLKNAYPTPEDSKFKILLSHNPSHWLHDIANSGNNIDLTLSGHTHAMQMSFFGYSPAAMRYPTWGGLYGDESDKHKLYVNIGLGTVGFPSRIGAEPEITLITLRRTKH